MSTVVIIQARLTSSRLPGKVLMEIGGRSLLERSWRCGRGIVSVDSEGRETDERLTVFAIPDTRPNDPLAEWLVQHNAPFVRGPEEDVLGRFIVAANAYPARNYVRITADCPFVRLTPFNVEPGAGGYASTVELGMASGLDVEAFTRHMLRRAHEAAASSFDREHVTPWMRRAVGLPENPPRPALKLSVDTQEDLDRLREWYAAGVLR